MALERLQKILSRAGVASRRKAEKLILQGRVSVNGVVARELGAKADPALAQIRVDHKPLRPPRNFIYLALNKPRECVTTLSDPEGRPTVMNFLKGVKERVYPVGRLDYHTEGLLLLTNDGDFANHVLSAASGIPKTYWAKVAGTPAEDDLEKLRRGILLDGRRTRPARIRPLSRAATHPSRPSAYAQGRPFDLAQGRERKSNGKRQSNGERGRTASPNRRHGAVRPRPHRNVSSTDRKQTGNPWLEVVLQEGRQNQIRRMFERIGHPVRRLKRVGVGSVSLGNLASGQYRSLTPKEIGSLRGKRDRSERMNS
jgi:23S rRNA pseudouridine2605 synthase